MKSKKILNNLIGDINRVGGGQWNIPAPIYANPKKKINDQPIKLQFKSFEELIKECYEEDK
jgi:hypothetical protein